MLRDKKSSQAVKCKGHEYLCSECNYLYVKNVLFFGLKLILLHSIGIFILPYHCTKYPNVYNRPFSLKFITCV